MQTPTGQQRQCQVPRRLDWAPNMCPNPYCLERLKHRSKSWSPGYGMYDAVLASRAAVCVHAKNTPVIASMPSAPSPSHTPLSKHPLLPRPRTDQRPRGPRRIEVVSVRAADQPSCLASTRLLSCHNVWSRYTGGTTAKCPCSFGGGTLKGVRHACAVAGRKERRRGGVLEAEAALLEGIVTAVAGSEATAILSLRAKAAQEHPPPVKHNMNIPVHKNPCRSRRSRRPGVPS